jgi:hypothetical protein
LLLALAVRGRARTASRTGHSCPAYARLRPSDRPMAPPPMCGRRPPGCMHAHFTRTGQHNRGPERFPAAQRNARAFGVTHRHRTPEL